MFVDTELTPKSVVTGVFHPSESATMISDFHKGWSDQGNARQDFIVGLFNVYKQRLAYTVFSFYINLVANINHTVSVDKSFSVLTKQEHMSLSHPDLM